LDSTPERFHWKKQNFWFKNKTSGVNTFNKVIPFLNFIIFVFVFVRKIKKEKEKEEARKEKQK